MMQVRSASRHVVARPSPVSLARVASHTTRSRLHAVSLLDQLRGLFVSKQSPVVAARDELLEQLLSPSPETARVSELVDELAASELPFREQQLGGGPWQVCWTKGDIQLWKATYAAGQALNRRNVASQDFNPKGRLALNKAEYAGGSIFVTASGTYEPVDDSTSMPKTIQANIQGGSLHLFGLDIPLPIRGTGLFEVMYLDDDVRIFRSGRSYAVQVRADVIEAAL